MAASSGRFHGGGHQGPLSPTSTSIPIPPPYVKHAARISALADVVELRNKLRVDGDTMGIFLFQKRPPRFSLCWFWSTKPCINTYDCSFTRWCVAAVRHQWTGTQTHSAAKQSCRPTVIFIEHSLPLDRTVNASICTQTSFDLKLNMEQAELDII